MVVLRKNLVGVMPHAPASYWAHGTVNQLNALPNGQPSLSGLPTLTGTNRAHS